jgi:putative FmdB family regulatory protein
MPLYEYECDAGHRFEKIQKFSDPPIDACPTCGRPVHKLMSSPAIQFKGTGWYITDYARKDGGGTKTEKSDSGKAASGETKSDAKAETKSDAKTETKSETKPDTKSSAPKN